MKTLILVLAMMLLNNAAHAQTVPKQPCYQFLLTPDRGSLVMLNRCTGQGWQYGKDVDPKRDAQGNVVIRDAWLPLPPAPDHK